jgi:hypothetical protein
MNRYDENSIIFHIPTKKEALLIYPQSGSTSYYDASEVLGDYDTGTILIKLNNTQTWVNKSDICTLQEWRECQINQILGETTYEQ